MNRWTFGHQNRWADNKLMDRMTNKPTVGQTEGQTETLTVGQIDGRMDRQTQLPITPKTGPYGQMDRWTDGQIINLWTEG
jgi:hypothetical protein